MLLVGGKSSGIASLAEKRYHNTIGRQTPCTGGILKFRRPVIIHTHDPDLVNRIANSDAVRPWFRPDGSPVDLTDAVAPPSTQTGVVALTNGEDAVALFEMTAPGVYQSHTLFDMSCRGRRAVDTGRAMVEWMFSHGADIVWGSTPRSNAKARWFNRQIGAVPLPTSDEEDEIFEIRKMS